MLERILSRGAAGAERAALEAGRAAGLLTGGQSRPGMVTVAVARRLGLNVDAGCSARQATALNALRADATLVVGPVSARVLRLLGPRVFPAEWCGDARRRPGRRRPGHGDAPPRGRRLVGGRAVVRPRQRRRVARHGRRRGSAGDRVAARLSGSARECDRVRTRCSGSTPGCPTERGSRAAPIVRPSRRLRYSEDPGLRRTSDAGLDGLPSVQGDVLSLMADGAVGQREMAHVGHRPRSVSRRSR